MGESISEPAAEAFNAELPAYFPNPPAYVASTPAYSATEAERSAALSNSAPQLAGPSSSGAPPSRGFWSKVASRIAAGLTAARVDEDSYKAYGEGELIASQTPRYVGLEIFDAHDPAAKKRQIEMLRQQRVKASARR
ncbi:hypothetical protein FRB97_006124 [Tulasnella sp. 331]|nr:hypothetical protein FRB97_006124 [Tulasnella sp. 331]